MYVGGGGGAGIDDCVVMEYDISLRKWAKLPPYGAQGFAMTVIDNQPVLVGGLGNGGCTGIIGMWTGKRWAHPYPLHDTLALQLSTMNG